MQPARIRLNHYLLCMALLTLAACTTLEKTSRPDDPHGLATHQLSVAMNAQTCRARIENGPEAMVPELDSSNIRLLSWNVKKGSVTGWKNDLVTLAADKDLVLIQEAVLHPDFFQALPQTTHWAFGPGYGTRNQRSGVMTLSRVPPLTHCNFSNNEPWLTTPKATTVTQYGLSGTNETLLVVNIHAINFSVRLEEFRAQMDQIRSVGEVHSGPVILSGDFNTWRQARFEVVSELADDLGLAPLTFEDDRRTRAFGHPLDYIFVRGLTPRLTNAHEVKSSDHNPISAELAI